MIYPRRHNVKNTGYNKRFATNRFFFLKSAEPVFNDSTKGRLTPLKTYNQVVKLQLKSYCLYNIRV
jgi:hypothetical protein